MPRKNGIGTAKSVLGKKRPRRNLARPKLKLITFGNLLKTNSSARVLLGASLDLVSSF
jgi:hypothetical protein